MRSWAETTVLTPTDFTDSHRFFRPMRSDEGYADFADDADFDLLGLGFRRFREILLMTCRILCFILGGFEEKAYFCG